MSVLTTSCTEWDKYWTTDGPPTGPGPAVDTSAPSVRILTPSSADSAAATPVTGAAFRVTVEADDDVGVTELWIAVDDGAPVMAHEPGDPPAPELDAGLDWDTTALTEQSVHRITAGAADAAGNTAAASARWAQVFNEGPTVVVAEPDDDDKILGIVPFTVAFPDGDAYITSVEFLADVWTVATVTAAPWTIALDTTQLPDGRHFLAAKATTVLDQVGASPATAVHVNNGAPTVTVTFPASGHAVAATGTLVLEADASDAQEGPLPPERVTWSSSADGSLGTGLRLLVTGLSAGTHDVTAVATNAWGTSRSASVPVTVSAAPTWSYCANIQRELFEIYLCTWCHDPAYPDRGYQDNLLDLTDLAGLLAGGKTTLFQSVSPCRPESSLIYNKVSAAVPWVGEPMPNDPAYPTPPAAMVERLRVWILEGAPPDVPSQCP
ncbi:MAG TPA: Ig-like domain-containing protein [bacterium]|nr:Ig-like domain-containing protein [bacterium]